MASNIERLPVYKSIMRLVNLLLDEMEKMPVKHRRTLCDRTMDAAYESLSLVHFAYGTHSTQERSEFLRRFLTQFTLLNAYVRIATERRLIPLGRATTIYEQIGDISRQIAGWKQSTDRR